MAGRQRIHRYQGGCRWHCSSAAGYAAYSRVRTAGATRAIAQLTMASDPVFRGDPSLLNPERLLVISASSCQVLSFLAIAARADVDVREYDDAAEGLMPEDDEPVRITPIVLRPRTVVGSA